VIRSCSALPLAARSRSLILERYAEAAQWARIALRQPNSHFRIHAVLAAALGHAGRIDVAKHMIDELLAWNR
jgi:hypothetical protein